MVELEGSAVDSENAPVEGGPHADYSRARFGEPIAFNALARNLTRLPKLTSEHKVAIILTAIPAFPNRNDQLFPVEVKPEDAAALLPTNIRVSINEANCLGPEMTIRVPASVETARFPWLDSEAETIEMAFGVREGELPDLSPLVLNLEGPSGDQAEGMGGASLRAIANAAAAIIYAAMADRPEGNPVYDLEPGMRLDGWIEQIAHELSPNGELLTSVVLPSGETPRLSLFSLLDAGTRSVILKLARPGKE